MPLNAAMYAAVVVTEPLVTLLEQCAGEGSAKYLFDLSAAALDLFGWMPGMCSALCCIAAGLCENSICASWGTQALPFNLYFQNRYTGCAVIIQARE